MGIAVLIIIGSLLFTSSGCMLMSYILYPDVKPIPPPAPPPPKNVVQDYMEEEIEELEPATVIYDDFFDIDDDLLD